MGGTVKRSSSLLTPSHDCLCTNAIVGYVDLSFLERPSLASSLYCSDCRLRGRSFYTLTQSHGVHDAAQQTSEQTAQSMTSLVLRTDEVGQRTADLVGVIIVIHRKVRKSTVTVCVCVGIRVRVRVGEISLARLSMHERHCRICRSLVSWTSVSCVVSLLQ